MLARSSFNIELSSWLVVLLLGVLSRGIAAQNSIEGCDDGPNYLQGDALQCNNDYHIDQEVGAIAFWSAYCCDNGRGAQIANYTCTATAAGDHGHWTLVSGQTSCPRKDGSPYPCPLVTPETAPFTTEIGMSFCGKDKDESPLMCEKPGTNFVKVVPVSIPQILTTSNCWRHNLSPPAATPEPDLKWDDGLAALAERWAAECRPQSPNMEENHTPATLNFLTDRGKEGGAWKFLGQNLCFGFDINECFDSMASEWNQWTYGQGATPPDAVVGHYTQMVWNETLYIGCAVAMCNRVLGDGVTVQPSKFTVCNYWPPGNVETADGNAFAYPYLAASHSRRHFFGRRQHPSYRKRIYPDD